MSNGKWGEGLEAWQCLCEEKFLKPEHAFPENKKEKVEKIKTV